MPMKNSRKKKVIKMIPDYQSLMLPILEYASDGKEHHIKKAIEYLANKYSLTQDERKELCLTIEFIGRRHISIKLDY